MSRVFADVIISVPNFISVCVCVCVCVSMCVPLYVHTQETYRHHSYNIYGDDDDKQ
jgi:hypothetical protein